MQENGCGAGGARGEDGHRDFRRGQSTVARTARGDVVSIKIAKEVIDPEDARVP